MRPRTFESYKQISDKHLIPAIGRIQLDKLTAQDVQSVLNAKTKAGLSSTTVGYIRRVLRTALGRAVKWGLIARNVAALVDAPTPERYEILPLTPDQVRTFLTAMQGDRLEALYT